MESTLPPPPPYGEKQMLALTLAPNVTALLSIIGATYILFDVARDRRGRQGNRATYLRLISGLSVCDVFFAGALFASTWPAPAGTPYVWEAIGNTQTCTAQGSFFHLGGTAVLYNASLSTYYVFTIRNGWGKSKVVSVEPWLHVGPIAFGIVTLIASLALKLFNSSGTVCKIASIPKGCQESWQSDTGATTCIRGDNAGLYNLLFNLIPKWVSIIIVTLNMILVYLAVRKRERKSRRWSIHSNPDGRMTKKIAQQSYLFVGALYLTNFLGVVIKVDTLSQDKVPFVLMLISSILLPSQGFWNAMVYLRPRYLSIRESQRLSALRRSAAADIQRNIVLSQLAAVSETVRQGGREESDGVDSNKDVSEMSCPTELVGGSDVATRADDGAVSVLTARRDGIEEPKGADSKKEGSETSCPMEHVEESSVASRTSNDVAARVRFALHQPDARTQSPSGQLEDFEASVSEKAQSNKEDPWGLPALFQCAPLACECGSDYDSMELPGSSEQQLDERVENEHSDPECPKSFRAPG